MMIRLTSSNGIKFGRENNYTYSPIWIDPASVIAIGQRVRADNSMGATYLRDGTWVQYGPGDEDNWAVRETIEEVVDLVNDALAIMKGASE